MFRSSTINFFYPLNASTEWIKQGNYLSSFITPFLVTERLIIVATTIAPRKIALKIAVPSLNPPLEPEL
jgi:hypothetical protein